ncbi:MAG: NAD-dependent epimerase/dehydratase family protein [Sphingobacteriaceae bacterium]|nr:MAG: NAD-dependent epimerase/dehydratase family protein [Sphingobacteriaceae bacterium]
MKIIVTGSLGNISKPLTETLVQKGHSVTVISSRADKQEEITALGASAATGSVEDADFLTTTFKDADAVYCMIPPANYFDQKLDLPGYTRKVANNYAQAIQTSGVKRVVFLSSIGAHLAAGNGIIQVYHEVEDIIGKSTNAAITFMRPTSFYYNLLGYVQSIKYKDVIAVNYGEDKIIWVAPKDIAAAIAEELETTPAETNIRYVASDERTGPETAAVLGAAIGKPDLQWQVVSDEQAQTDLQAIGMQPSIAAGLVQMYASARSGKFWEDYEKNKPVAMGTVSLEDFAKDFAAAYHQAEAGSH